MNIDNRSDDSITIKKRASLLYQERRSNLIPVNGSQQQNFKNDQVILQHSIMMSEDHDDDNNVDNKYDDDDDKNHENPDDGNSNNDDNNYAEDRDENNNDKNNYDNNNNNNNNIEDKPLASIDTSPVIKNSQKSFEVRTAELLKDTKKNYIDTSKILNKNYSKVDQIIQENNSILNDNETIESSCEELQQKSIEIEQLINNISNCNKNIIIEKEIEISCGNIEQQIDDYDNDSQTIFDSNESVVTSTDISNIQIMDERLEKNINISRSILTTLPPTPPKELSVMERAKLLISISKMKNGSSINDANTSTSISIEEDISIPAPSSTSQQHISYSPHQYQCDVPVLSSSTSYSRRSELHRSNICIDNGSVGSISISPSWNNKGPNSKNNSPGNKIHSYVLKSTNFTNYIYCL
jgi:hypothetical protein